MQNNLQDLFKLEVQGVEHDLRKYRFSIYGKFGAGKSTFATQLFNKIYNNRAVVFEFEDRFKGIPNLRGVRIHSWSELNSYIMQLRRGIKANGGKKPFDCIIIDPVGKASAMCEQYICETNDVDAISDLQWGKGYNLVKEEFELMESKIKNLGIDVQYVGHNKLETITPSDGKEYHQYTIDVQNKIKGKVCGEADFILFLSVERKKDADGVEKPVRRLFISNFVNFELKSPIQGFPDYIEYETPEEGVDKFLKAWDKAVKTTESNGGYDSTPIDVKFNEPEKPKVEEPKDEPDLKTLQTKAEQKRDKLVELKDGDKRSVAKTLKLVLGTAKISECTDEDKLLNFINMSFTDEPNVKDA